MHTEEAIWTCHWHCIIEVTRHIHYKYFEYFKLFNSIVIMTILSIEKCLLSSPHIFLTTSIAYFTLPCFIEVMMSGQIAYEHDI